MSYVTSRGKNRGLTLVAIIAVTAAILILATLALGAMSRARERSRRISCICRLKQIGLGFRMWGNDHGGQFPWSVAQSNGGTFEFAMSTQVWRHFQVASNELNSPKILVCPADPARTRANFFVPPISNANISYFVGLDADATQPQSILSGDRNLTTNGVIASGIISIQATTSVAWTTEFHRDGANIALGDGSAQQVSSAGLAKQLSSSPTAVRLSIP